MIIQVVLVSLVVLLIVFFLKGRNTQKLKAGHKLLFVAFAVFAIIAIIWPELTTDLAHLVGVGRGADLLLYALVLAFVYFVIAIYLKFKSYEQRITTLVRHIAITEAQQQNRK